MNEDNLIPLSYISQYNYCKRRVALLMNEQQWNDNAETMKGNTEHKIVHTLSSHHKGKNIVISDLYVCSRLLSLSGRCDSLEAYFSEDGYTIPFLDDEKYELYPIEYKHGKLRDELEYELQLCAQAMCLEEMYSCKIDKGAIFYISSHRKKEVFFSEDMRNMVKNTADSLLIMRNNQYIPKAEKSLKCEKCSLKEICMPDVSVSIGKYMKNIYESFGKEEV